MDAQALEPCDEARDESLIPAKWSQSSSPAISHTDQTWSAFPAAIAGVVGTSGRGRHPIHACHRRNGGVQLAVLPYERAVRDAPATASRI